MRTYPLTFHYPCSGLVVATCDEVPGFSMAGHSEEEIEAEAGHVIQALLEAQEAADARNH